MFEVSEMTKGLEEVEPGFWVSPSNREIFYPTEGNQFCFQVEEKSFWFGHRNRIIASLVQRFSSGEVFFDIGGGNGFVSKGLCDSGVEAVLVEPGMDGSRNAVKRGLPLVICSTLEDAGFQPESLPAAGIFDVLEHIEDSGAFLKSLHRFMKPGGRLYVTVPALSVLWSDDDVRAGHFRRYTTRSLRESLSKSGFEVEFCSYFFVPLAPGVFLFRTLPSWVGLRRKVSDEQRAGEHSSGKGCLGRLFGKVLGWEGGRISRLERLPFGTSCVAVARKSS